MKRAQASASHTPGRSQGLQAPPRAVSSAFFTSRDASSASESARRSGRRGWPTLTLWLGHEGLNLTRRAWHLFPRRPDRRQHRLRHHLVRQSGVRQRVPGSTSAQQRTPVNTGPPRRQEYDHGRNLTPRSLRHNVSLASTRHTAPRSRRPAGISARRHPWPKPRAADRCDSGREATSPADLRSPT